MAVRPDKRQPAEDIEVYLLHLAQLRHTRLLAWSILFFYKHVQCVLEQAVGSKNSTTERALIAHFKLIQKRIKLRRQLNRTSANAALQIPPLIKTTGTLDS